MILYIRKRKIQVPAVTKTGTLKRAHYPLVFCAFEILCFLSLGLWADYLYIRRKLLHLQRKKNMVENEKTEPNPDFLRI
jgi:hypothetical protein